MQKNVSLSNEPVFEVVSAKTCPYVQRVMIALYEKDIPFTHKTVDLVDKPDWFLTMSPFGKVPLLKDNQNRVLFESQVINEYLDDVGGVSLHPDDPFEKAENRAWIELISSIIMSFGGYYYARDEATLEDRLSTVRQRLDRLEEAKADGPYFGKKNFTLVDAAAAPLFSRIDLLNGYHKIDLLAPYEKLTAWSAALLKRPSVIKVATREFQDNCLQALRDKGVYIAKYL